MTLATCTEYHYNSVLDVALNVSHNDCFSYIHLSCYNDELNNSIHSNASVHESVNNVIGISVNHIENYSVTQQHCKIIDSCSSVNSVNYLTAHCYKYNNSCCCNFRSEVQCHFNHSLSTVPDMCDGTHLSASISKHSTTWLYHDDLGNTVCLLPDNTYASR